MNGTQQPVQCSSCANIMENACIGGNTNFVNCSVNIQPTTNTTATTSTAWTAGSKRTLAACALGAARRRVVQTTATTST